MSPVLGKTCGFSGWKEEGLQATNCRKQVHKPYPPHREIIRARTSYRWRQEIPSNDTVSIPKVPFMFAVLQNGHHTSFLVDEDAFVHKVVQQRRGGFCYELNGAFRALLRSLGFRVTLLSARVARDQDGEGPEFDHLTLRLWEEISV